MTIELAQKALKKYFGYDSFRPMQTEIIQSMLDKKDSLVETTRNIAINSIELQKDGFIVLYAYIDNSLENIVGVSPLLKAGTYKNLVYQESHC